MAKAIERWATAGVLPMAAALVVLAMALPVAAHVSFQIRDVAVGATFKGVLGVPHGCKGSPTIKLRVQIPAGIVDVKPQPKPGWQVEIVSGKSGEAVREVAWSGGKLLAEHYDEFAFRAVVGRELKAGTIVHFPVVQECETGVERWIDTATKGGHSHGDSHEGSPAPSIRLVPAR